MAVSGAPVHGKALCRIYATRDKLRLVWWIRMAGHTFSVPPLSQTSSCKCTTCSKQLNGMSYNIATVLGPLTRSKSVLMVHTDAHCSALFGKLVQKGGGTRWLLLCWCPDCLNKSKWREIKADNGPEQTDTTYKPIKKDIKR